MKISFIHSGWTQICMWIKLNFMHTQKIQISRVQSHSFFPSISFSSLVSNQPPLIYLLSRINMQISNCKCFSPERPWSYLCTYKPWDLLDRPPEGTLLLQHESIHLSQVKETHSVRCKIIDKFERHGMDNTMFDKLAMFLKLKLGFFESSSSSSSSSSSKQTALKNLQVN